MTDVFSSDLAQVQKDMIVERLETCKLQLLHAVQLGERFAGDHWTEWILTNYFDFVVGCIDSINGRGNEFVSMINDFKAPRF